LIVRCGILIICAAFRMALMADPAVSARCRPLTAKEHFGREGDGVLPVSYRIVTLQAFAAIAAAAVMALISAEQAVAALLAGAVGVIPSGFLAWRVQVERSPGRLLGQGVVKFVLTVVLMAMAFAWLKPASLGFFATLVLMQLMYVVGALGSAKNASG